MDFTNSVENEQTFENQDDINNMVDQVIQEESEEIVFSETLDDTVEDESPKVVAKSQNNNLMLFAFVVVVGGIVFHKQIKEIFDNLFKGSAPAPTPTAIVVSRT